MTQSALLQPVLHAAAPSSVRAQLAELCRRRESGAALAPLPSGHVSLDARLPGGGWPLGALTELLSDGLGLGELSLLLPALGTLAKTGRCIAWIDPPYLPYPPALLQAGLPLERVLLVRTGKSEADSAASSPAPSLWTFEQLLRCPAIGAALSFCAQVNDRHLRRLQLAAEAGGTWGILYRPTQAAREPSPAALRLQLEAAETGLQVEIRKVRGAARGQKLLLPSTHAVAVHTSADAAA